MRNKDYKFSSFLTTLPFIYFFDLQPMLDVPIYGRIATLELFKPPVSYSILIYEPELIRNVSVLFLASNICIRSACLSLNSGGGPRFSVYIYGKIQILCSSMGCRSSRTSNQVLTFFSFWILFFIDSTIYCRNMHVDA